ncbi:50S ribosomal protein L11 methyltransferase [Athalassotoga saccharophila]|uniref:50S ribosomal protein L11 methyltransferase n=1 Tax=Athalassotoga saccharophila TaxID=1441386 RepID=UPI00137B8F3D|nr:50S ribosomal protein L11 methyltransferase [Athalassotoga saccharophila]BBJ28862.1 ribosomal protein L11 methyltransferase [Athalassotoga saccharophila]
MERRAFKFKVKKSESDQIMEYLCAKGWCDFYSESLPEGDEEYFHLFCDEEIDLAEMGIEYEIEVVTDEDWIKKWADSLKIVDVGDGLYVNPNPDKFKDPDGITVRVIPGMAFGTGEHESTKIAIRFLKKVVKPGSTVCDVGCGSGILSAFAVKLGASRVLALDVDKLAISQALETARINNVYYEVRQNDLLNGIDEKFDVIVANLYYDLVIKMVDFIPAGAYFVVSGIDRSHERALEDFYVEKGFKMVDKNCENSWCGFIWRRDV